MINCSMRYPVAVQLAGLCAVYSPIANLTTMVRRVLHWGVRLSACFDLYHCRGWVSIRACLLLGDFKVVAPIGDGIKLKQLIILLCKFGIVCDFVKNCGG